MKWYVQFAWAIVPYVLLAYLLVKLWCLAAALVW